MAWHGKVRYFHDGVCYEERSCSGAAHRHVRERPRILIAEIMDAAAERAISRRTMTRACGDLGITEIHNGPFGGIWAWPQDQHPSS